jgi:D-alanine-D-alanine ligase
MQNIKNKKIAVLMGGWNEEANVSLSSGEAVYKALENAGYNVYKIIYTRNIVEDLKSIKPDIIFNALHGKYGEDGKVQGLLDILQIPYTHSGVLASAVSMNKVLTKEICATKNVNHPEFRILKKGEIEQSKDKIFDIAKPFVIKPISEGSSVGVEIIQENENFNINNYDWQFGDEIMIEKYIKGKEIEVSVFNGKALGAIEIRPKKLFYDYECKYTSGMSEYIMPAEITEEQYKEVLKLAENCHKVLNCKDISRIDFILSENDNKFYLLEVNTHPGLTEHSLFPKIAKYCGISFLNLVEFLLQNAAHE